MDSTQSYQGSSEPGRTSGSLINAMENLSLTQTVREQTTYPSTTVYDDSGGYVVAESRQVLCLRRCFYTARAARCLWTICLGDRRVRGAAFTMTREQQGEGERLPRFLWLTYMDLRYLGWRDTI